MSPPQMTDSDDAIHPPGPPPAQPPEPALPEAASKRSRWIGIVWAVPLAALLIVGFLGVRALADRGIDVVVTFETGAGAEVKDTKVIYQGVEAGHVTKIEINPDGRRVDMTLRVPRKAEPGLTTNTTFWLVGARPNLSDISSVKAALAGPAIGVSPGIGGTPARSFVGLSEPPLVMPGTPGTDYVLTCTDLGTARVGSLLFFRGQEIGKVTAVRFTPSADFQLDVFVNAPYDKLIQSKAVFWVSSPVQVSLTDKGASASLQHAGSLLNGAVELDFPTGLHSEAQSPAKTTFPLYDNRREAETGASGPKLPYAFRFSGPAGELTPGAPVRMLGFQIGEVTSLRLEVDATSGLATTSVMAVLYPQKLHIDGPHDPSDAEAWRKPTDAVLNRLLARGHRARLQQSPPLIGGRLITFDAVPGAGAAVLGSGQPRLVPTADASGNIDDITRQVNQLLTKVNGIPLDAIGQQVRQITERVSSLVSSPQLASSIQHLNSTLAQMDRMVADVAPQIGPLVAKLNRAADEVNGTAAAARSMLGAEAGGAAAATAPDTNLPAAIQELSDAARSIRALADYLGRHPESLIRGRSAEQPSKESKEPRKDSR